MVQRWVTRVPRSVMILVACVVLGLGIYLTVSYLSNRDNGSEAGYPAPSESVASTKTADLPQSTQDSPNTQPSGSTTTPWKDPAWLQKPVKPANANEKTSTGLMAMGHYVTTVTNYMTRGGDPQVLADISAPGCTFCEKVLSSSKTKSKTSTTDLIYVSADYLQAIVVTDNRGTVDGKSYPAKEGATGESRGKPDADNKLIRTSDEAMDFEMEFIYQDNQWKLQDVSEIEIEIVATDEKVTR